MRLGQTERRTHDYIRHDATSLFAALDTQTGTLIGQIQRRHRSVEFRNFLDTIERNVPPELDVHLILGQLRHSQNATDSRLAGEKTTLSSALHSHLGKLAQPC
jgi:hypothetical protein